MGALLTVALVAIPLLGCLAVLALPRGVALLAGLTVALLTLLDAVLMALLFDYHGTGAVQFGTDLPWVPSLGLRLRFGVDGISLPLVLLTALLVVLCAGYLLRPAAWPGNPRSFVVLLLLTEVGMLGTFVALDLLLFFVFFEVVLIPMYAIIAGWGGSGSKAAARQFILYTLLGSGVLLVGILLIAAQTSTLDMVRLAQDGGAGMSRAVQILAFVLVAGGLAVKVPMWPLHSWLPDAHTAAPTVGSVLLAGVLLKMGTYGLVRIALPILPDGALAIAPFLGALGVIGIGYAAFACFAQRDLKRLIAFSSVGHMGFVLLAISTLTPAGVNAAIFGSVAHGLITGLLFFLAGGIKERYDTTDIGQLGGLLASAPRLGGLLVFAAVASLGMPGLAGFWGEMLALLAAFDPAEGLNRGLYLVFMVLAGIGAVLTAGYLLVMLRRVAQGRPLAGRLTSWFRDLTGREFIAWAPLVAFVLVVGLWPRTLLGLTDPSVRTLLGGG